MKKLLSVLITFTLLLFPALAQEVEDIDDFTDSEITVEPEVENELGPSLPIKIGGDFSVAVPIGSLNEFAKTGFGGGIDFEIGIPIPLVQHLPFVGMLFRNFGVGAKVNYNYHLPKSEDLSSVMDIQIAATALTSIPLGTSGLCAVPEIGIGLAVNLPQEKTEPKTLKPAYTDQIYTFGIGLRFAHEKLLNSKLELALTPVYSVSPEHGTAVQNFTFKLGALYKIK